jgi:eukaryotic translation initiation factor 2-alpha kinase 4
MFSTGAERIVVIERLRQSEIIFPSTWDPLRTRQRSSRLLHYNYVSLLTNLRSVIEWLLQHDPGKRPSALELSQSSLLPPRIEDEYFKGALRMMSQ